MVNKDTPDTQRRECLAMLRLMHWGVWVRIVLDGYSFTGTITLSFAWETSRTSPHSRIHVTPCNWVTTHEH